MKYAKFFQFVYLIFAGLFIYKTIVQYSETGTVNYSYVLLSAVAIFVFFFRRKFMKKFENRDK